MCYCERDSLLKFLSTKSILLAKIICCHNLNYLIEVISAQEYESLYTIKDN